MATAATVLSIASIGANRAADRSQRKAARAQQRKADIVNAKQRRQDIARSRRERAATIAQGANQGVGGGSSTAQAAGSVQTQGASNLGFANTIQNIDRATFRFQGQANRRAALGRDLGTLASVAGSFSSSSGVPGQ